MPAPFTLKIITRRAVAFEGEVESLVAPATEGSMGVWANHAPLVTALEKGKLKYRAPGGQESVFTIEGGYLDITNHIATVLTNKLVS